MQTVEQEHAPVLLFRVAACWWWLWGAYLLVYGWMRPPEFWLVTYGPPTFMYVYGGSLWFRARAAIWLGVVLLGVLLASGAVNGFLRWRTFQVLLALQLALVVYSVVQRSVLSESGD